MRFTVYDKSNTPDIDSNRFTTLYADRQGHLWLGTEVGSVTRYTGKRFLTYTSAHGAPHVTNGYQTPIWSARGGIWGRDRPGLRRFVGGRWEHHPLPAPFLGDGINVGEEPDGTLWVAAPGGRLLRIEHDRQDTFRGRTEFRWAMLPPTEAVPLHWRSPSGSVWRFERGRDAESPITLASSERRVTLPPSVQLPPHEDKEGNLWLATNGDGLHRLRRQVVTVRQSCQAPSLVGSFTSCPRFRALLGSRSSPRARR